MVVTDLAFSAQGYEILKLLTKHYSGLPNDKRANRNKQAGWHFFLKIHKRADWDKNLPSFSNFLVLITL